MIRTYCRPGDENKVDAEYFEVEKDEWRDHWKVQLVNGRGGAIDGHSREFDDRGELNEWIRMLRLVEL